MTDSPERRTGVAGRLEAYGLSVVRSEEKVVGPVIDN
jgi:hypothetical protein